MLHFPHIRRASLLLTLKGPTNATTRSHSSEILKRYLSKTPRTSRNNANILGYQKCPFSLVECGFHTSLRRDVNPLLWVILKPVAKISAALTGRGVRKWYRAMDPKERKKILAAMKERWYLFAGTFGALVSFFIFYYWSHIEETPFTGRKRFVALTHDQICSIAKSQATAMIDTYKDKMFDGNSLEARRVMDIAKRLLLANPELQKMSFDKWEVYVVNDPLVNACVLPTGHVFVFEGMLKAAHTQDELAIILGHEMAHALLEHGIEELSYGQFIDYVVIVVMAALWCVIPTDGIAIVTQWFHNKLVHILTNLPHSRALEEEADKVGAMLAAKACYDIRHGVVLWKKMEAVEKMTTGDSMPNFLSTHPHNLKRADFFDFIIPKADKWRAEGQCPRLPNNDPRLAIEVISKMADEHIAAKKTGQNLKRVRVAKMEGARAVTSTNINISEVMDIKEVSASVSMKTDEQDFTTNETEPAEFISNGKSGLEDIVSPKASVEES